MKITYRRDREHNYMVLEAPGEVQENLYQVRMLTLNEIPGLLKCELRMVDGISYFYYEITSKQPMERIFHERSIGYEELYAILSELEKAFAGTSRYLLDENRILLEPEYMYMDMETKELAFCYLPCASGELEENFRKFAEYLLKNLDHEDHRAVVCGYRIYSGAIRENYSVMAVLQTIHQTMEEKQEPEKKQPKMPEKPLPEPEKTPDFMTEQPVRRPVKKEAKKKKRWNKEQWIPPAIALVMAATVLVLLAVRKISLTQAGGSFFLIFAVLGYVFFGKSRESGDKERKTKRKREKRSGERVKRKAQKKKRKKEAYEEKYEEKNQVENNRMQKELGEMCAEAEVPSQEEEICECLDECGEEDEIYGNTTILQESLEEYPMLTSLQGAWREPILLKKEKMTVGKMKGHVDIILSNSAISRMHASMEQRPEGCFLTDLNSTNGTFVNGERLNANESRQIHTGDEIFFAGDGYSFQE